MATKCMATKGMATKVMATKGVAAKGMVTKGVCHTWCRFHRRQREKRIAVKSVMLGSETAQRRSRRRRLK